jgi:hypothetical protein
MKLVYKAEEAKIDLIATFTGPVAYDIYLDNEWMGSRRTVEQCWSYIKYVLGG